MIRSRWMAVALGLLFFSPAALAADEAKEMQDLIDLGIKSLGGKAKLQALTSYEFKITANMSDGRRWVATYQLQSLDVFRVEAVETIKDNKNEYLLVVNGKEGWIRRNGGVQELKEGGRLQEAKDALRFLTLTHSLLLLEDPKAVLKPAGEAGVNDKAALGVKISGIDKGEMLLYLDKKTGLPARLRYMAFDADEKALCIYEETMSEWKEINGINVPTKVRIERDGQLHASQTLGDFKHVEKFKADQFKKPEGVRN